MAFNECIGRFTEYIGDSLVNPVANPQQANLEELDASLIPGSSTADQYADYNLFSGNNPVNIYESPDPTSKVLYTVPANSLIGWVYSWVNDPADNTKAWFEVVNDNINNPTTGDNTGFYDPNKNPPDVASLKQQVKQVQAAKEAENPSFFDSLPDWVKWGGGFILAVTLIPPVLNAVNNKK